MPSPALGVLGWDSKVSELRTGLGHLALYAPPATGFTPPWTGGQRCKPRTHRQVSHPGGPSLGLVPPVSHPPSQPADGLAAVVRVRGDGQGLGRG